MGNVLSVTNKVRSIAVLEHYTLFNTAFVFVGFELLQCVESPRINAAAE